MAKKRKKKIPLRKLLRRLEKKADKALSEFVRAWTAAKYGPSCVFCRKAPIQCCFHFIRRKRKILRWDFRNVIGACHRCNYIEYRNPDLSRAWYIRTFGVEQYLALVDESEQSFIPDVDYLTRIVDCFTADLAKLKAAEAKFVEENYKLGPVVKVGTLPPRKDVECTPAEEQK